MKAKAFTLATALAALAITGASAQTLPAGPKVTVTMATQP